MYERVCKAETIDEGGMRLVISNARSETRDARVATSLRLWTRKKRGPEKRGRLRGPGWATLALAGSGRLGLGHIDGPSLDDLRLLHDSLLNLLR